MNKYIKILLWLALLILLVYVLLSAFMGFKEWYTPPLEIKRPERVIVSLTTLPHRLSEVPHSINSIAEGEIKPNAIYLHIPLYSTRDDRGYCNLELDNIKKTFELGHPDVPLIINRVERDYGPVTKLFPVLCLEKDSTTNILCIDDDKVYDKSTLRHLLGVQQRYPKSVICVSGWNYLRIGRLVALPLIMPIRNMVKRVQILQCYNGVLYTRGMFEDDFENWVTEPQCMTTDDILISGYLARKNVEILSIRGDLFHKDIKFKTKSTLGTTNLLGNKWIKCIAALDSL